jgi:hypothetical protein
MSLGSKRPLPRSDETSAAVLAARPGGSSGQHSSQIGRSGLTGLVAQPRYVIERV